jgi:hypothetical protein
MNDDKNQSREFIENQKNQSGITKKGGKNPPQNRVPFRPKVVPPPPPKKKE